VTRPDPPAGRRVKLRRPSADDADEFVDRARASRALHERWVSAPDSAEAYAALMLRASNPTSETLLVHRLVDGAIVGVYNLSDIVYGALRGAHLGYYAFEPFSRQGYMGEGLRLVLRHAFSGLGLHRVEANIQPGNEASIELVRGAGFRLEGFSPRYLKIAGRWRDHERWAITVDDMREGRRRT
jgi:ribosomal-protein-alanine N-acetyltransferase